MCTPNWISRMEDVWTYPRPPALQPVPQRIRIVFGGVTVADTLGAYRVLETSHPPVYYLPPAAFVPGTLHPAPGGSLCEWKGRARYWTIRAGGRTAERAGWSYPDPEPAFADIQDYVAVYAGAMDACFVDEEKVLPQPGGFYGGWITANLQGPFKGVPGSMGW
jgi:uncharacterized protein (DUF427 family)